VENPTYRCNGWTSTRQEDPVTEFVIAGAKVFDGESPRGQIDVHVAGEVIRAVGGPPPEGVEVVDGSGAMLLPGLIDAHTHASAEGLRHAFAFGITTELDMGSVSETMIPLRAQAAECRDMADVRSPSFALAHPDGHPHQLREALDEPDWPTATTAGETATFVEDRIGEGADYLKVIAEDGHVLGASVPCVAPEVLAATVEAAHARGKLVVAHAMTLAAAEQMVAAGVDGLTHVFVDTAHTPEILERIAESGMFVVPTLSILASITNQSAGRDLAHDPRVQAKLPSVWRNTLSQTFHTMPEQNFAMALSTVAALHRAGVDVLAGTDAAILDCLGVAHGASLHDELRLLVLAGFTPTEALRAATALPADRFNLTDRGRIRAGLRADLVLVDGDPTTHIADTLSVRAVWRQGTRLGLEPVGMRA
jgi:imidazolonepropionase-like amidohydrolase